MTVFSMRVEESFMVRVRKKADGFPIKRIIMRLLELWLNDEVEIKL